jgi:cytochrome P450
VVDFAEARAQIAALMRHELAEHRANRPDDFVSQLLVEQFEDEGGPRALTEDELARILTTFAVAGHETTMNAASTLVHLLSSELPAQDRLRADPALAPRYVEELLRYRTPSQNFARRTTCPVTVEGTEIPADDAVLLSYAAANRDPDRFPDPDRFDPDRDARGHLAFGWGIHLCLGATLARAELAVLLETLCGHPRLLPAGPATWGPLQGGNHIGLTHLPLRFERS